MSVAFDCSSSLWTEFLQKALTPYTSQRWLLYTFRPMDGSCVVQKTWRDSVCLHRSLCFQLDRCHPLTCDRLLHAGFGWQGGDKVWVRLPGWVSERSQATAGAVTTSISIKCWNARVLVPKKNYDNNIRDVAISQIWYDAFVILSRFSLL